MKLYWKIHVELIIYNIVTDVILFYSKESEHIELQYKT